jgi:hypothetical protein
MPDTKLFTALAAVAALITAAVFLFRLWDRRQAAGMEGSRRLADALYRSTSIHAEEPRFAFDAATAQIMQDEEAPAGYEVGSEYALTRYARNPDGEYFMVMIEVVAGSAKLVLAKPVEQHIARYVLGNKYIAPPLV